MNTKKIELEEIQKYLLMLDKQGQQALMNVIKGYALALMNQKQSIEN